MPLGDRLGNKDKRKWMRVNKLQGDKRNEGRFRLVSGPAPKTLGHTKYRGGERAPEAGENKKLSPTLAAPIVIFQHLALIHI